MCIERSMARCVILLKSVMKFVVYGVSFNPSALVSPPKWTE